jgi:hypothetical protein
MMEDVIANLAISDTHKEIIDSIASVLHENWLIGYRATYGDTPRMKPVSDSPDKVDIAVEWSILHPEWKVTNLKAARFIITMLLMYPHDITQREHLSAIIHEHYLVLNPYELGGTLDNWYYDLSEIQKDKDRANYDIAVEAILNAPQIRKSYDDTINEEVIEP